MEADWELEIGGDAPVIDAAWPGFVDLREEPGRIGEVAETQMLPGLASALLHLNKVRSALWTSKTDVFVPEGIDPGELAATLDEAASVISCYIDILFSNDLIWNDILEAEIGCRALCARLQEIPLRRCRVDVIVRRACGIHSGLLGATVYLTACGRTSEDARERLSGCLGAFAESIAYQG